MSVTQRMLLTRCLVVFILVFLLFRWLEFSTPPGLSGPPLFNVGVDITYWGIWLLHLPDLILYNRAGAILFDGLLLLCGLLLVIFPLKRRWIISFSILLAIYGLIFNSVSLVHTVTVSGLMVVLLPFWV